MSKTTQLPNDCRPALRRHVRLHEDRVSARWMLLFPEGALELDDSGLALLNACGSGRTFGEMVASLASLYDVEPSVIANDAAKFFRALSARGLMGLQFPAADV